MIRHLRWNSYKSNKSHTHIHTDAHSKFDWCYGTNELFVYIIFTIWIYFGMCVYIYTKEKRGKSQDKNFKFEKVFDYFIKIQNEFNIIIIRSKKKKRIHD